jgi:hypothetical protein
MKSLSFSGEGNSEESWTRPNISRERSWSDHKKLEVGTWKITLLKMETGYEKTIPETNLNNMFLVELLNSRWQNNTK